jgi:hypothetical protein
VKGVEVVQFWTLPAAHSITIASSLPGVAGVPSRAELLSRGEAGYRQINAVEAQECD